MIVGGRAVSQLTDRRPYDESKDSMSMLYRHILVAAVVSAIVGTTLLLGNAVLAREPFLRSAMYFVVPFTVAMVTRLHALRGSGSAS